jgi:protein-S-isoprenylcysteine O-methyltransferase Ste14
MSTTLVTALRVASLVGLAAPLLLAVAGRPRRRNTRPAQGRGDRAPLLANLTAFGLFFPCLLIFPGAQEGYAALLLAATGCLLAVAGAAVVLRARAELGSAWSLVPTADKGTGLVTTGPYRRVRHPIYLGFSMLAMGQALAFASWPAIAVLLAGIVPTFVWRASAEEKVLIATFGERYTRYRKQTKMIIPRLL